MRELIRLAEFVEEEWPGLKMRSLVIGLRLYYKNQLPEKEQLEFEQWLADIFGQAAKDKKAFIAVPESLEDIVRQCLPKMSSRMKV